MPDNGHERRKFPLYLARAPCVSSLYTEELSDFQKRALHGGTFAQSYSVSSSCKKGSEDDWNPRSLFGKGCAFEKVTSLRKAREGCTSAAKIITKENLFKLNF